MKKLTNEEAYELQWKDVLDRVDFKCNSCEVLYNMGNQEVLKKDGQYFLASTINHNVCKEITRETARELENIYEQKNKFQTDNFFKE